MRGFLRLRITIVLEADAVQRITGDNALGTLYQTQKRLSDLGDERFPIIEYATRDELQEDGES